MNVELADERILILTDRFSMEHAEGRAWTRRLDAFGALAKMGGLLKPPKDEDFQIVYRERRLQPFWRIACTSIQVYERTKAYAIAVAPEVRSVMLGGEMRTVAGGRLEVSGRELCRDESRKEVFFDGLTRAQKPVLAGYLSHPAAEATAATLAEITHDNTIVVPSEAKASTLVREVMAAAIGRPEADVVTEEIVRLEAIELYYRPVYAFRFKWRDKEAVVEFDALNGEIMTGGATFEQHLGKLMDPHFLLDISTEAVDLFIPGANLAKVAIAKGMQMASRRGD